MMHSGNTDGNGQNITAGTNTTAAVTLPLITAGGSTDRMRWHLHHCRLVHRSGIDVLVITAGWYASSALMLSHHSQMVCQTSVGVLVITAGWYTGLALVFLLSQPDGTLNR
jgi:hypothetical protein